MCLRGLPLFYTSESHLGSCLLLVSDAKEKKVRTTCFMIGDLTKKKAKKKVARKIPEKKRMKTIAIDSYDAYVGQIADDDEEDIDDIPF